MLLAVAVPMPPASATWLTSGSWTTGMSGAVRRGGQRGDVRGRGPRTLARLLRQYTSPGGLIPSQAAIRSESQAAGLHKFDELVRTPLRAHAALVVRAVHRTLGGTTELDYRWAGPLARVEGRTAAGVSEWIEAQSVSWRCGVQTVAIDMCTVFKAAVCACLPHATLVVYRFHVAQLANAAVTEVRRRVTVQQRGHRGRKGNREWELRNRLTRSAARMHADHLDPMVTDFEALPSRIGQPILAAWNVEEDLMDLFACTAPAPTGPPSPTC